ncbi:hypothetical protein ACWGMK_09545 [Agrobacterium deltaense]|uniref:hypothetical protein n=1 Tax=Agrobacterium sp. YIC 4121 TaxID=1923829 RepID=UPI00098EFD3C|nr:hypothetical protein [Agrobacterium sp. YIC 4121]OOO33894.1 hypothetical protein BTE54_10405 [Agrobacterium sp. YIC 4121]
MTAHKKPKAESGRFGRFFVWAVVSPYQAKHGCFRTEARHLARSELPNGVGGIASVMHVRKMGEAKSPFNGRTRETDSDFQGFRLDVITGKKCCFEIV